MCKVAAVMKRLTFGKRPQNGSEIKAIVVVDETEPVKQQELPWSCRWTTEKSTRTKYFDVP